MVLEELDLDEPDNPLIVSVARRKKVPGAASYARKTESSQLRAYQAHPAPRRVEIEAMLWELHGREQSE